MQYILATEPYQHFAHNIYGGVSTGRGQELPKSQSQRILVTYAVRMAQDKRHGGGRPSVSLWFISRAHPERSQRLLEGDGGNTGRKRTRKRRCAGEKNESHIYNHYLHIASACPGVFFGGGGRKRKWKIDEGGRITSRRSQNTSRTADILKRDYWNSFYPSNY